MKKIEMEIWNDEHFSSVHLGNGEWLKFKNKTKAEKFVRKYRRVILDNVKLMNVLQPQINLLYRQNILQLDESTKRSIGFYLKNYDERFEYIFKIFSSGNQNSFVFQNIDNCFEHLHSSISLLYSFSKKYKHYALKDATRPILKNLEMLYGQYDQDKRNLRIDETYLEVKEVKPLKLKVS